MPAGPLRRDAEWMQALLTDPAKTSVVLVSLPEEMPVSETVELDAQVRDLLRLPRGPVFVNAMPDERFTPAEQERLWGLVGTSPRWGRRRGPRSSRPGGRSAPRSRWPGCARPSAAPLVTLPLLAAERWGRRAVERIADAMEGRI